MWLGEQCMGITSWATLWDLQRHSQCLQIYLTFICTVFIVPSNLSDIYLHGIHSAFKIYLIFICTAFTVPSNLSAIHSPDLLHLDFFTELGILFLLISFWLFVFIVCGALHSHRLQIYLTFMAKLILQMDILAANKTENSA